MLFRQVGMFRSFLFYVSLNLESPTFFFFTSSNRLSIVDVWSEMCYCKSCGSDASATPAGSSFDASFRLEDGRSCGTATLTLLMTILSVLSVRLFLVDVFAFMFVCCIRPFNIILK